MRKKLIVVLIAVLGVFAFVTLSVSETDKKIKDDLYRQVEIFSDAISIIQLEYVDDPKPKNLIYGALKGMLSSLDSHSQFLDPDSYNELKIDTEGKFGGIGIEITLRDGVLTVVTPIDDTPAWKAGIKAGDRIVKIDNESTRDLTLTDAVKKMRGKPGDAVNLVVLRESEKKILEFKIVRGIIKIKDIKEARILEDNIGYVRLIEFREESSQEFNAVLERMAKEGMNALILDLRNNPGGLLDVAVDIAGKFTEKGKLIVSTVGRKKEQNIQFLSREKNPILDIPMAILINEGSASGSEIVAGCLQDYKRAIILGVKSFGKGSVQTVVPLSDGSALRLTTSRYFTPSGKVINEKGVLPDIVVEAEKVNASAADDVKGSDPQEIFEQVENKEKIAKDKEAGVFDYKTDNQLMHALDVLKAIRFYNSKEKK